MTKFIACSYEVEALDLTAFGFPGMSFTGEVHIEPDYTLDDEEWYIESATAFYEDGETSMIYRSRSENDVDRVIFSAIRAAVLADRRLCDRIDDKAMEEDE
jgi:hypothetical protein